MASYLASESHSINGHASKFQTLFSKLVCDIEQKILAFSQELELLPVSPMEFPIKDYGHNGSNGHAMMQQSSYESCQRGFGVPLPLADALAFLPKFSQESSRGIDVDEWLPSMIGKTSHALEEKNSQSDEYSQKDELLALERLSSNSDELRPSRKTKLSTKTPQAQMNWDLEDIPTADLWVSNLVDVLSRKCPMCCTKSTTEYLHRWLEWWENIHEPQRRGMIHKLLESSTFRVSIFATIFLNTVFVIITTNIDMDDALTSGHASTTDTERQTWRLIAESSFTAIYCAELLFKLKVHGLYLFVHSDFRWNIFDFMLVIFSVVDLAFLFAISSAWKRPNLTFLRALRILKFARVLRVVRIVKCVHELKLMMDCVLNSVMHLFWSVILMMLVLTMFALVIVQGMRDYVVDESGGADAKELIVDRFDSVQRTMLSLFMSTTGGEDWGDQYVIVGKAGAFFELVFVFYISFFVIVALNIVMSTFVEKAFRLAMPDFETTVLMKRQETLAYAKELTHLLVSKLDEDHDGYISLHEFQSKLVDPKVKDFFAARDLNLKDAQLFFHMLLAVERSATCESTDQVKVETFVGACLRLRGFATAIDLQALHFEVRNLKYKQEHQLSRLEQLLQTAVNSSLSAQAK